MPKKKGKGRSPKGKGIQIKEAIQFVTTDETYNEEETQFEEQTMDEIEIKEEDVDEILDDDTFLAIENEMKLIENANREKQVECVTLLDKPSTSHDNISMGCDMNQEYNQPPHPQQLFVVPQSDPTVVIPRSMINQSIVEQQPKKIIQLSLPRSMQPQIILKRLPQSTAEVQDSVWSRCRKTCEYCGSRYSNNHFCKRQYNCYRCHAKSIEPKHFEDHIENTHDVSNSQREFQTFLEINFRDYKLKALKCYLCMIEFKFLQDLETHVKVDHKLCRVCGVRLLTDDKALLHIERHDKLFVEIYQCSVCGMEAPLYPLAEIHKNSHSSPYTTFKKLERKKELSCPYCYYFTSRFHSMIFHISLHQPTKCRKCKRYYLPFAKHIFDQRFNECSVCNPIPITSELLPLDEQLQLKLETLPNLVEAMSKQRVPATSTSVASGREMISLKSTKNVADHVVSYPCLYCREVFHAGMELYSHIKISHIVCAICCKKFSTVLKLNDHFVDAHTMYKCKTCNRVYDSKKMILNHLTQNHLNLDQTLRGYTFKLPEIDMHKVSLLAQCPYCLIDINPAQFTSHVAKLHEIEKCPECSCFKSMNFPCSECFEFVDPIELGQQSEAMEQYDPLADPLQQEPSIVFRNESIVTVNVEEEITPEVTVCKRTRKQNLTVAASSTDVVEIPETIVGDDASPEEIPPDSPAASDFDTGDMNNDNDSDSDFVVIASSSKEPEKKSSPVVVVQDNLADTSQFIPILPMPPNATEDMRLSKLKRLIPRKVTPPTPTKAVRLIPILPVKSSDAQQSTASSNTQQTTTRNEVQQISTRSKAHNTQQTTTRNEVQQISTRSKAQQPKPNKKPPNKEPITIELSTEKPITNKPSTSQTAKKKMLERKKRYRMFENPDISKHITIEDLRVFLATNENFEEKLEQYFYHTFGEIDYINPSEPAFVFRLSYSPQMSIEVDTSERIKSIPCLFCTLSFPTLKEHFTHLITVHRMCKVCHAPSPNFKSLLHHLALHEEGEYMVYTCMDCVAVFSCYGEFTKHRNACKKHSGLWRHGKKISTKMSRLQCPYCCLNFVKEDAMINHVMCFHKVKGFKFEGVEEIQDSNEIQEEESGPTKDGGNEAFVPTRSFIVPFRRTWDNLQDIKEFCMKGDPVEDHLIDYCTTLPSLQFYLNHGNSTVFIHRTSFRPNYTMEAEVSSRIKCVPCIRCDVRCDTLRSHFEHQIKSHFECKTCQIPHKRPIDLINHFEIHEAGAVHLFNCDKCLFVCLSRQHWSNHCELERHKKNPKMKRKKLSAKVGGMECPYCCLNFVEELELMKHVVTSHRVPNFAFTFNDNQEKVKFTKDLLQVKPWRRTGPRIVRKFVKKTLKPTRNITSHPSKPLVAKRKRIPSETNEENVTTEDGGDDKCSKSREMKNVETSMTSDVIQVRSRRRTIRLPKRYLDDVELKEPVTIDDLEQLCTEGQPVEDKLLEFCYCTNARMFYIQVENPIFIFCHSTYKASVQLTVETPTRITSVQCQYCDATFDTLKAFYEHQIQVHYLCKSCQIVMEDPKSLIEHWKEHEEAKIQLHFCRFCALIIPTYAEWRQHTTANHVSRGNLKYSHYISAKVGGLECPRCCLNFIHELDLIAHVSRWHEDLNIKFELKEGEDEVLAKKVGAFKSKGVKKPQRKRKVSTSSDSSSDSDGPADVDDFRVSTDDESDYRKKRRSGAVSMAKIVQTYAGIKVETKLDELDKMLCRDENINDHLISYCYSANSVLYYIREIRPVFIHVHSSKKNNEIQVETSDSITSVPCQFCGINLKSLYNHLVHLIKAHRACKKCMITHKTSRELLDHFKQHRAAEILMHYCKQCGLTFPDEKKFDKHCRGNHGFIMKCIKPISARVGELECPYCFSSFYKEIDLILHVLKYHKKMQIEYEDGRHKALLTVARSATYDSDSENEEVKEPVNEKRKKRDTGVPAMDSYNVKVTNGSVKLAQLEEALFGDPIEDQLIQYCYNRYADIHYFRTKNIKFLYLYSLNVTQGILTESCVRITSIPCQFCPQSFPTLHDHVTHIMKEHFACKTCLLEHHDVKSLIAHLKLHELGLLCVFICKPCCLLFNHIDNFCRHLMEKHQSRPGKDYKTRMDHREFIGSQILAAKIGTMECPYCPCNFADELILIRHVLEEHKMENFTFQLLDDDDVDWPIPESMTQPLRKTVMEDPENAIVLENTVLVENSENVMQLENSETVMQVENSENVIIVETEMAEEKSDIIAMAVENADINVTAMDMATEMSNLIAMAVESSDTNAIAMEHSESNAMTMENAESNAMTMEHAETNAMAMEHSETNAMTMEHAETNAMAMEHSETNAMAMVVTNIQDSAPVQTFEAPAVANQETVQTTNENLTDSDEDLASRLKRRKKEVILKKKRTNWRNQSLFLADLPQMPKMDDILAMLRMGEPVAPLVAEYFFNVPSHNMFFRQKHAIFINVRKLADRINWLKVEDSVRITCMPCQHCNSSYDNLTDFCSHLISSHYMCKMCELPHHDMEALIEHTRLHERGNIVIYYCRLVSKIFRSFEEHKKHARNCTITPRSHHRVCFRRPVSVKIGVLECPYCPINYTKEMDLIQHIVVDHRIAKFEYQLLDTDEPVEFEIPPIQDEIPPVQDETEQAAAVESVMEVEDHHEVTETMDSFEEAPQVPDWSESEDLIQRAIASPEPENNAEISHLLVGVLDKLIRAEELGHPVAKLLLEYCIQLPASSNCISPSLYLHVTGTQTDRVQPESPTRLTTIPCLYCAMVSNGLKSHFQHLINDHFFCKLCQISHDSCMSLLIHLKLHESENINMYVCKRSFLITNSFDVWRDHLETCTDESIHCEFTNLSMKLGSLECPYCPFNFTKQIELIQHVYYTHRVSGFEYEPSLCHVKVLNGQSFIYEMGETKITSGESPKILKNIPCKYCDIKSVTLELHEKHLKEVHHLCKPCKKLHTDLCALKLHHIEHELKKVMVYVCKECPALLSNVNECKSHAKIHRGALEKTKNISCTIGTLECPYCSLNFFAEIELVKHLVKGHKND